MSLFIELSPEKERVFRKWARANYVPFAPIDGIWHPSVQDECAKINAEHGAAFKAEDLAG